MSNERPTYALRELATALGVDYYALRTEVEESDGRLGPLAGIRIGGRWRFSRRAVDAWLSDGRERVQTTELLTAILTTLEAIYAELPSRDAQQVA